MSHPTFWHNKTFFYPIGNTPPVCLTEHVPPEQDAIILLLGCGDPRSILYTVAIDHGAPNRFMDITCCDWDPAVIARNILLLTLVADSVDADRLLLYWSIFYDIFIDKKTVLLLQEQCHKLIEAAANIPTWDASVYARFIKFATVETLNKTRDHWLSYAETLVLSDARQKQLKRIVLAKMKEESSSLIGGSTSAMPSAAPLSFRFMLSTRTYDQYWKTGITSPNITTSLRQLNPTFLFSMAGRQFDLHYGTDPCAAFHLGLTLTEATYDDGTSSHPGSTVQEVWDACRQQFSRWSAAFHRRLISSDQRQSKIIIRFAYGDALAFCDGLQLCMAGDYTPSVYSSMWGGSKFLFHDRSMPTSFNVIETSNLSDHLGLLNVLVATTPLLEVTPYTSVTTSSLLSYKGHSTQRSAIEERVLLDFPTLSILLGIMPTCFSSGITFFNGSEAADLAMTFDSRRYHERVSWKFAQFTHAGWCGNLPQRSYRVHFEPGDLASKLLDVYLKMFKNEDLSSAFEPNISFIRVQNTHYHRKSFAYFLRVIRSLGFVETCWPQAIRHFINNVVTDSRLLIGTNHIQNLLSELHMLGIYSEDIDLPGGVSKPLVKDFPPYQEWSVVPQIICIVLKVPRFALRKLEIVTVNENGNPILECETFWDNHHNFHDSIRPTFGDIIDSDEGQKVIIEDPEGLRGSSPLIVSFFIPMWILANQRHNLHVGLCLKATPKSTAGFISALGPQLRIYSTGISDKENVLILPQRPDNPGELPNKHPVAANFTCGENMTKYSMIKEGCDVFSKKLEIIAPLERKLLADKVTRVDVKQITPYRMEVVIGGRHSYFLDYPIAIDGSRPKIRIARRSSYIEVDAPPCNSPLSQLGRQPFPITIASEEIRPRFSCHNAPYVNIDCFPALSLLTGSKIWVCIHLRMCMSRKERNLHKSESPESWGPLLNFKASILSIFLHHVDQRQRVYNLIDLNHFLPRAIIILSCIRLDTSSATILGDAVVIFPNPENIELIGSCLSGNAAVITKIYGDELRWWNHAFPVFAERCRRWDHLPTCEYMRCQRIPLSEEYKQSPLCSCGKGKNLGPFLENTKWRSLAPHAIRIALTPIFPVPYLEDVTEPEFPIKSRTTGIPGYSPSVGSEQAGAGLETCQQCCGMGKPGLLHCSACRMTRYCSKECQIADWKNHKHLCKMRRRLKSGLDSQSQLVGLDT